VGEMVAEALLGKKATPAEVGLGRLLKVGSCSARALDQDWRINPESRST